MTSNDALHGHAESVSELWAAGLEHRTQLDSARMARGATALKKSQVGTIEIEPGLMRAAVDSATEATVVIGVSPLPDVAWDAWMQSATEQSSMSAALLSGELPFELAEQLLPAPGELSCDCSCPDGGEPCVHAASVLHAAGDLFDVEPFALVLIRGRGRNELLTDLRARRALALGLAEPEAVDLPRGSDPGTLAAEAWRRAATPLEAFPRVSRQPGTLLTLAAPPPSDSGIDDGELRALVHDAAARAHGVLTGDGQTGLGLGTGADVVRRSVSGDVEAISAATKVPLDELRSAAQAWQFGGQAGLSVSRKTWDAPVAVLQPGVDALGANAQVRANRVSLLRSQLRLDEDGNWWLFHADDELGWVLASAGVTDPGELV